MVAARNSRNAKRGRLFIFAFLEILAAILPDVIHPLGEGPARLGPVHGHVGNVPHGEQIDLHHVHSTGAKLLRGCELEDMSIRRSGSAGASPSRWWRTPNYRVDRAIPFPLRRSTINPLPPHRPCRLCRSHPFCQFCRPIRPCHSSASGPFDKDSQGCSAHPLRPA